MRNKYISVSWESKSNINVQMEEENKGIDDYTHPSYTDAGL